MSQVLFDKLQYVDRLKSGGMTDKQARVHADALDGALKDSVATKEDVANLGVALRADMKDLKIDIFKWFVPLLLGNAALVAALVKLL